MGFSENRCKWALKESGNDIDNALNILFTNMENPDYDLPLT